jgi:GTPase SAR1 family protein
LINRPKKKLSPEFREALAVLENSKSHIFLTGKAGTGKSTLLKVFLKSTRKRAVVVAPTGVAALNVGGQTIHSFFKFPPRILDPASIRKVRNRRIYEKIDTIIIDEVSMVRADLLDNIDKFLRVNRNSGTPFGGVRMIFIGDLFQIPPVVPAEESKYLEQIGYDSPYFFSSKVFQADIDLEFIELTTVYRQEDGAFIRMLDQIRSGDVDYDLMEELNGRITKVEPPRPYITLTAYNRIAERINQKRLNEIEQPSYFLNGKIDGQFPEHLVPAPRQLELKEGAQVMILKNDPEMEYVNGTIGIVESIQDEKVRVIIKKQGKEKVVRIESFEWEINRYKINDKGAISTDKIGSFKQFPLKLSWAMTIHKSQGKTFDRVLIHLGKGAFAPGQTYVALSRCRSLEGIYLMKAITGRDIFIDPVLVEYYDRVKRM